MACFSLPQTNGGRKYMIECTLFHTEALGLRDRHVAHGLDALSDAIRAWSSRLAIDSGSQRARFWTAKKGIMKIH